MQGWRAKFWTGAIWSGLTTLLLGVGEAHPWTYALIVPAIVVNARIVRPRVCLPVTDEGVDELFIELEKRVDDTSTYAEADHAFETYDRQHAELRQAHGEAHPQTVLAACLAAWIRHRLWNAEAARERLPDLIRLSKELPSAVQQRVALLIAASEPRGTATGFERAMEVFAHSPIVRARLAGSYARTIESSDGGEAESILRRALDELASLPDSDRSPYRSASECMVEELPIRSQLATLLESTGDLIGSWAVLQPALDSDAELGERWRPFFASHEFNSGRYLSACRRLMEGAASAAADDRALAYACVAGYLCDAGAVTAATAFIEAAMREDDQLAETSRRHVHEAKLLLDAQSCPELLGDVDEAWPIEVRALVLSRRGKHEAALAAGREHLTQTIAAHGAGHPYVSDPLWLCSRVHEAAGEREAALLTIDQALTLSRRRIGSKHPQSIKLLAQKLGVVESEPEAAAIEAEIEALRRLHEWPQLETLRP